MSIRKHLSSLPEERRVQIGNDLQVELPKTKMWIYPYHVENGILFLPYNYAIRLGYSPMKREAFPIANIEFRGQLRDYQQDVKKATLAELNTKHSCVLSLHVGWGKSIFAVYLASKLKLKTLILVNRLVLAKQWKELVAEVCPGTKFQLVKSKDDLDPMCDVYLMNAINATKKPLGFFDTIGTVIVDELHLICAKTLFKAFFYLCPRYLIGLSATPRRPDGLDALINLYFGDHRIAKPLKRQHTVYGIHTGIKLKFTYTYDGRMDWNSVLNAQAEHPERNQLLLRILQHFSSRYFLVLCKRIEQGNELIRLLTDAGESVTDLLGTKKEFDENARIVVATTQKCGVGFSHDKLDALLLASDVEEYFIQYLGRVFRTPEVEPLVFDVVDDNSVLKKHFSTRRGVYRDVGGRVKIVRDLSQLFS